MSTKCPRCHAPRLAAERDREGACGMCLAVRRQWQARQRAVRLFFQRCLDCGVHVRDGYKRCERCRKRRRANVRASKERVWDHVYYLTEVGHVDS